MSKWYKISGDVGIPDTKELLLEERDGILYEKFVINENGISWQTTKELKFPYAYNIERLKNIRKIYPKIKVEEITEEEVFSILL